MTTERKVDGWIDDIVGALFDPIIVMPGGWGDSLPEWLKNKVALERLVENIVATRESRGITATDAEAACYLFTASLTAPIGSDWTQIYLYVVAGEMKGKEKFEMPEDIRVETLTESQWRKLKHLKGWIYERRVQHRKEKGRQKRYQAKEEATAEELETRIVQPSFF